MLSYVDHISETSQSTAQCELKEQRDRVAQWDGGGVWKRAVSLPRECFFFNFQVKMQGFNHFVANKLDLWPETWSGDLIDPLGR